MCFSKSSGYKVNSRSLANKVTYFIGNYLNELAKSDPIATPVPRFHHQLITGNWQSGESVSTAAPCNMESQSDPPSAPYQTPDPDPYPIPNPNPYPVGLSIELLVLCVAQNCLFTLTRSVGVCDCCRCCGGKIK